MSWIRAIAVDLDGTIACDDVLSQRADDAIKNARHQGIRVVLVTGRRLAALSQQFPGLVDNFDAVVAENGGVLLVGERRQRLAEPVDVRLAATLKSAKIPCATGDVLLATSSRYDAQVLERITTLGIDAMLLRNRSELMILPAGVSKGSGLRAALDALQVSPHNTIAIGDAENDHAMFEVVELSVATANAVPALKGHADLILDHADGDGVAELIHERILGQQRSLVPGHRTVDIGELTDGRPAQIPATPATVMVVGGSGRGKSYLAGVIAEQLIEHAYRIVVIDPEGEQSGLADLPGVRVIHGGTRQAVERLIEELDGGFSVVLDLGDLDAARKTTILAQLAGALASLRTRAGIPHWLIVDEAHVAFGADGPLRAAFDPSLGTVLITYQPDQVCAEVLSSVDLVLSASPPVDQLLGAGDTYAHGLAPAVNGQAMMLHTDSIEVPAPFRVAARATAHQRHQHKYAEALLPVGRGFLFRTSHDRPVSEARTLREFRQQFANVTVATAAHHLHHGDLSRWISEVIQDRPLAAKVAAIERDLRLRQRSDTLYARTAVLDLIDDRYQLRSE
jgi:phosphoglycolate phosphatase (TIGR01487 family)